MDQICVRDGCNMFLPDTTERVRCEKRCRLDHTYEHISSAKARLFVASIGIMFDLDIDDEIEKISNGERS